MSRMRVYSCYFGGGRFEAMARALGASIAANAPGCEAVIESVAPPKVINTYHSNTEKLGHWRRAVDALPDGERLVLLDSDTLVLRPLAAAFDAFASPVALTSKGPAVARMRYNCGVVFIRGGPEARAFFAQWQAVNDRLFADRAAHTPLEGRHGGMNQAAWGAMREQKDPTAAHVADLPCAVWNACYPPLWSAATEIAHIVHYKSDLRASIFTAGARYPDLVALWRKYERISRGQE